MERTKSQESLDQAPYEFHCNPQDDEVSPKGFKHQSAMVRFNYYKRIHCL